MNFTDKQTTLNFLDKFEVKMFDLNLNSGTRA